MAAGELEQPLAALGDEVAAGRVVEARLDRQQPDLLRASERLERVDVEPVLVDRDPEHPGARRRAAR